MQIKQLVVGALWTNCYFLISGGELGIVDPGGEAEKILKEIKKIKAKPKYIINTHCHLDHTEANEKVRTSLSARTLNAPHLRTSLSARTLNAPHFIKETGIKILIHEAEKGFINFKVDRFLKEEDEIKIGDSILKVIHTPGHTPGGICLLGEDFVLTGDTLFKDGYGRTDLPGGSQKDLENSLKKLSKLLKPGMTVYPGHGEIFKV